jgi:aryl-alcohol dehydrogenase-like predicted oxidoreductase
MKYGSVAGVSDRISRLVLGSGAFATLQDSWAELLERFVAAGGTAIDTAYSYGRGESERQLGAWLERSGRRDELQIVTKGGHHLPDGTRRVTPEAIDEELPESLSRMRTDRIDLYLLHRDDPTKPVGPIVECLNRHKDAGRIKAFGASNWTIARFEEANDYAASRRLAGFAAISPNLALAVPSEPMWPNCVSFAGDTDAIAWVTRTRMPLFAWSSGASGFFSGRFSPEVRDNPDVVRVYYRPDNWQRLERVREFAARKGATPTQVALAWVLNQPFQTFALVGPRTVAELDDCLGAVALDLTAEDLAWLNLER